MLSKSSAFQFRPAALIRFSGEDHADFLQGQGTADLRGGPGLARYCLWLDHRGLIQADSFVLRESPGSMLLLSYACPAQSLMDKFDRHIIADDVTMEDLTGSAWVASVPAASADAFLKEAGASPPDPAAFLRSGDALCFVGRRLGGGSIDYLVTGGNAPALPPQWDVDLTDEEAERLRITSGIPLVGRDLPLNSFNPVEAGLLSAVSFDKGCYLGQEVVARVHRLGRTSRRMVQISGPLPAPKCPFPLEQEGGTVGELLSVVKKNDNWIGMGWLKNRLEDGRNTYSGSDLEVASLSPA